MITSWIIFITSIAILLGIGFYSSKIVKSDGRKGFLIGSRTMGNFVGAATLMATGYSGWGFIGASGSAYRYGTTEILGNFMFGPAILFGALFFASYMKKRGRTMGGVTVPDYITRSHPGSEMEKKILLILTATVTILLLMVFLVGQIKAVALLGSSWLGISFSTAAIVLTLVILIYTSVGGFSAIARTDAFMVVFMTISGVIILAYILKGLGADSSIRDFVTKLDEVDPYLANPDNGGPYGTYRISLFLTLIYAFFYTVVTPHMGVRFLALNDETKPHVMALYMLPMGILMSLVPLAGLFVRSQGVTLEDPDNAMGYFLLNYTTPIIGSFITLFVLFAMKSTANSVIHTISSAISNDLAKGFGKKDGEKTKIDRVALWIIGGVALTFVLGVPMGMLNFFAYLGNGTLIACLIAPMFFTCLYKKGTARGAIASILTGFVMSIILIFQVKMGWVEAPLLAGLCSVIAYVIFSEIGSKKPSTSA